MIHRRSNDADESPPPSPSLKRKPSSFLPRPSLSPAQTTVAASLLALIALTVALHLTLDILHKRAALSSSPSSLPPLPPPGSSRLTLRTHSPLLPSVLVHPDVAALMADAVTGVGPVPAIVHFVIGAVHSSSSVPPTFSAVPTFHLQHLLAIKAARDVLSGSEVWCHVVNAPDSVWWEKAQALCTYLLPARSITHIFGRPVLHRQHKADILRLEALLNYGGVALDLDVIIMQDWDEPAWHKQWLNGDLLIAQAQSEGSTWPDRVDTAVIAGRKQSQFLKEWYATFRTFNSHSHVESERDGVRTWKDDLDAFGSGLAQRLALTRPHLVTFAPPELFGTPYAADRAGWTRLYQAKDALHAEKLVALHLWQTEREVRTEKEGAVQGLEDGSIPRLDSTEDVCKLAETSLYGIALKRAMLAGSNHQFSCP